MKSRCKDPPPFIDLPFYLYDVFHFTSFKLFCLVSAIRWVCNRFDRWHQFCLPRALFRVLGTWMLLVSSDLYSLFVSLFSHWLHALFHLILVYSNRTAFASGLICLHLYLFGSKPISTPVKPQLHYKLNSIIILREVLIMRAWRLNRRYFISSQIVTVSVPAQRMVSPWIDRVVNPRKIQGSGWQSHYYRT